MKIAVIKETRQFEERVSCTPEIVKKFINLGFKVSVQSDAGMLSSYFDNDYKNSGAEILGPKVASSKNSRNRRISCVGARLLCPNTYQDVSMPMVKSP